MLGRLTHQALRLACLRGDRRFAGQRHQLEKVQREKLAQILRQVPLDGRPAIASWEDFRERFPLTRYADWRDRIDAQRAKGPSITSSPLVRYQPTSGSSERLKLIPYTQDFLGELDAAIAPWVASMYRQNPGLRTGVHYWSVSWLPESQRHLLDGNFNDDSELLGGVKRLLAAQSQAVPAGVAFAGAPEDALFATLAYLLARDDVSLLSVWSPTFMLQMLDAVQQHGEALADVLATGKWGRRAESLRNLAAPHAPRRARLVAAALAAPPAELGQRLWPGLALVSAWDTADAAPWAAQLRLRFPQAAFEGKGLWATEGVVTIPYDGRYPLSYQSHAYEFERLSDGVILAPWELKEGDEVSPILTGGNGLLRYRMDDSIAVTGFYGQVPCFQFQGRRFGVDLVGEKMSPEAARQVLAEVALGFDLEPVSLLAVDAAGAGRSGYVALFGQALDAGRQPDLAALGAAVEQGLGKHFHYELARNLGQLEPATAVVVPDGWAAYQQLAVGGGMIAGNIKPEPVRRIPLTVLTQALPQAAAAMAPRATVQG
ncbi:MAG: GH3 auxin-responsive promoter family protein [Pseudomonadota bacterium]